MSRRRNDKNNFKGNSVSGFDNVKVEEVKGTFSTDTNTHLCSNFGNINYSYLPGSFLYNELNSVSSMGNSQPISVPGVMCIPVIETIGKQENLASDPINLAAQRLYAKVREVNSGAKNYDQNNLMIHVMGMDSIYSYHSWMIRTIKLAETYSRRNFYVPNVLAEALDLDIENITANLAQLRAYINLFAERAKSISIPNIIPLITEHARMYNHIYMDGKSILGQMYIFDPVGLYRYEENENSGYKFGTLQFEAFPWHDGQRATYESIKAYGDALLTDLLNSQDMALMSGDILKAFPESTLLTLPTVEDIPSLSFVYDEDMLLAVHNGDYLQLDNTSKYAGSIEVGAITANYTNNNISQTIKYTPNTTESPVTQFEKFLGKLLIDQHKESPDLNDNYTSIRFKYMLKTPTASDTSLGFSSYGTELLFTPSVYFYTYLPSGYQVTSLHLNQNLSPSQGPSVSNAVMLASPFEMAPILYIGTVQEFEKFRGINKCFPVGELYNPTIIDEGTYKGMVIAYLMACFGV